MLLIGACHCGNISFALRWEPEPTEIPARACSCSFCSKLGGLWTSCPTGSLRVGRSGGGTARGRAREPMLLDPDVVEGEPAADDKDRGEQQRDPRQCRPTADHRGDKGNHDRHTPP